AESPCMVFYAGAHNVPTYNALMNKVLWRSSDNRVRTSLYFSWVYWTNARVRYMVMDRTSSHVYSTFGSSIPWTVAAMEPTLWRAMGGAVSMLPTEITSNKETVEFVQSLVHGDAFLGASRPNDATPYSWTVAGLTTGFRLDFTVRKPAASGFTCLKHLRGAG